MTLGAIFEAWGVILRVLELTFGPLGLVFEALGSLRGLGAHFGGPKIDLLNDAHHFGKHFGPIWESFW